jgi:hypothetical protein
VPAGEKFTLWVRYKGGSVLAKHVVDGKQKDLKWVYGKPAEFTWKKIGTYTRAELGETLGLCAAVGAVKERYWTLSFLRATRITIPTPKLAPQLARLERRWLRLRLCPPTPPRRARAMRPQAFSSKPKPIRQRAI